MAKAYECVWTGCEIVLIQLAPWSSGRPLVWDATCPDTFAPSHRGHATRSAGCVGEQAEEKKAEKYAHLAPAYLFQPVAIETSGAIGSYYPVLYCC